VASGPDELKGARTLVTGASGFIGSHLTRRLLSLGADVHALTSVVSSVYPMRLVDLREQITLHEGSLTDRGALEQIAATVKPDYVFHLGAYTHVGKSWSRVDECVQVNVQGTVNLLMALAPYGYKRFINTGTSEIYGDIEVPFREDKQPHPISPYSVSKYAAEEYCRLFAEAYGWPVVRVRPFNAYGPAQSPDRVIPEIITRAVRGERLRMTQGKQTREFNYVEDLAEGFVQLATAPDVDGELFNLGCGVDVSMREVAPTILDLMGNPSEAEFGAFPDRPTEIWEMRCDPTKAQQHFGYEARTSLQDGLAKTIEWYREELAAGRTPFALAPS
jgi:nucleoside-diphosphate-sugar epimerase